MTTQVFEPIGKKQASIFVVGFAMVFIVLFSVTFLFEKSLRLDETQTLWQTSHSLIGVLKILAQDVHLPLYFFLVRAWETLFGSTALAIRSFSLIFLVLSIPIFYLFANRAFGRREAIITVLLAMSSPFLLWYGAEGRMYTLLLFFTIVNQYAYLGLWREKEDGVHWTLYALTAMCGALTHYFFLFVLLPQAIFFLSKRDLFSRSAWWKFFLVALVVAGEYGAWFLYRYQVGEINADPYLAKPTSIDVFDAITNFFFGFQSDGINTFLLSIWPLFVLAACTLLVRVRSVRPETLYMVLAAVLPIGLAFVVSISFHPLFLSRYLIIALPALYILLAHFILIYSRPTAYALVAATVVIMQSALFLEARSPNARVNENYREAAYHLTVTTQPDDLVVVSAPFTRYPLEHYYAGKARLSTFPVWERYSELPSIPSFSEEELGKSLERWREQYTYLYVLTSYDQGYEEDLRLYLDHRVERVDARSFSPGLDLYVYRLRYL